MTCRWMLCLMTTGWFGLFRSLFDDELVRVYKTRPLVLLGDFDAQAMLQQNFCSTGLAVRIVLISTGNEHA